MPTLLGVPVLSELAQEDLAYGRNYLVEFDPESLWYETSLCIAARALKLSVKTEYHTYVHAPDDIREALSGFHLDLKNLEEKGLFRIMDTYTALTGLPIRGESSLSVVGISSVVQVKAEGGKPSWLSEYTSEIVRVMKEGIPEDSKGWLHIDDDTSIFNRYFPEAEVVNIWQTRIIPLFKFAELISVTTLLTGAVSESFLKQFEAQCDGTFDFKSREEHGEIRQYARLRSLRGKACDSRWRRLTLSGEGIVAVDLRPIGEGQLGVRGWIKGPKR